MCEGRAEGSWMEAWVRESPTSALLLTRACSEGELTAATRHGKQHYSHGEGGGQRGSTETCPQADQPTAGRDGLCPRPRSSGAQLYPCALNPDPFRVAEEGGMVQRSD